MKTTVLLFCTVLAFLSVSVAPQAQATCQEGCLTNQSTALGEDALLNNTSIDNTGIGFNALFSNTGGSFNTATGYVALRFNTAGFANTANGAAALYNNTTGSSNTATGVSALFSNTIGIHNTANGYLALFSNTGDNNTAIGFNALGSNTTGDDNIALGESAGFNLTTGRSNIDIGSKGLAGESNTIRIGTRGTQTATIIAGIRDTTVTGGVAVMIDANGRLGTVTSSARFKEAIRPMDKASEAILALKPVTFRYKPQLDPEGIPQFGLVAEDVEKVNPDLVARDEQGKLNTVRYDAVNAMLLNEFLKEHRKVEALQASFAQQQKESRSTATQQQNEIKALAATLKKQAAQIQKVSAQIEASKPAPKVVLNR